ncbi:MAG: hypothetical protein H9W82_15615 [Lactobacillus sp.]|nr:hypothetical protein [Lactobacillus sp.]
MGLADSVRERIANGASDQEVNDFVELNMSIQRIDLDGYITNKMNSQEQKLYYVCRMEF